MSASFLKLIKSGSHDQSLKCLLKFKTRDAICVLRERRFRVAFLSTRERYYVHNTAALEPACRIRRGALERSESPGSCDSLPSYTEATDTRCTVDAYTSYVDAKCTG